MGALVALLGLGSLTVGSAAALSLSCCSATCESCPASFCRDSDADKAPKTAVPGPVWSAGLLAVEAPVERLERFAPPEPRAVTSGFVRPLRR